MSMDEENAEDLSIAADAITTLVEASRRIQQRHIDRGVSADKAGGLAFDGIVAAMSPEVSEKDRRIALAQAFALGAVFAIANPPKN